MSMDRGIGICVLSLQVPNAYGTVGTGGDQMIAIGGERHRFDFIGMARKDLACSLCFQAIPKMNFEIGIGTG